MPCVSSSRENALVSDRPHTPPALLPLVAACVVATIAFWAYSQTLLPGVDLGDTGGFQAGVLWPEPSARRAYPLYYALATPFTAAVSGANPARGLNLFSAVWAAAAVGLLSFFVSRLTGFAVAGIAAGLLLAFSHTFWTQAIIAEVYSLHLSLIAATMLTLLWWSRRPSTGRLALFFAVYALAFGNHLGMILLFVPCVAFLFAVHPRPRELLRPATIALAVAIAVAGASQYAQGFMWVWSSIEAPRAWPDRIAGFWMDATKSDWRGTMVLGVEVSRTWDRIAMWWWDARQQFGIVGLALALMGAVRLWTLSRPWALFVWLAYAISSTFALTYNVGDTHVFLLPGHFFTALAAGIAVAPIAHALPSTRTKTIVNAALAALAVIYAGWRGWDAWPAIDRHTDRRAEAWAAQLTQDVDERSALLVSKMDWQLENVLLYAGRYERPGVAWVRLDEVLPHFPFLLRDNLAEDRDLIFTVEAASEVRATYGSAFDLMPDRQSPSLLALAEQVPRGAPYVMTWLSPATEGASVDPSDLNAAVNLLARGAPPARTDSGYELWAGLAGDKPVFHRSSPRPFIDRFTIGGDPFLVRMDSWLPGDTFRREGFGHLLRGREPVLWIERGVSLMWVGRSGAPAQAYGAGLYATPARFRISAPSVRLARIGYGGVQSQ